MRLGTSSKLSQNTSTIAAIMRFSATAPGRFSSRLMVGCEHRSAPLLGSLPTAILKAGSDLSASQSLPSGVIQANSQPPVLEKPKPLLSIGACASRKRRGDYKLIFV